MNVVEHSLSVNSQQKHVALFVLFWVLLGDHADTYINDIYQPYL